MIKKNVLIRGPLLTQSGYGVHSRQVFKWLISREDYNVKCIVTPWGVCSWKLDRSDPIVEEIMSRTVGDIKDESFDISFQIQLPNEWNPVLANKNIGITAGVETNTCNPEWIEHCRRMDAVIVPSEFTKSVFVNTGLEENLIHVIHESYPERFDLEGLEDSKTNKVKDLLDNLETKNNFLILGQLTGNNSENDRKNTFNTIKAFIDAYKDDKDVGLIIKTNSGRNTKIDKKKTFNMIQGVLKEIGKPEFPKIHVLHGSLSEDELITLYTHDKVKYLLSASKGEGFGLPILESARLGLPVIATNWSGHLDFMKLGNFTRLDYTLKEIHESRVDNRIFMKDTKWANIKHGHLRLILKKSFDNYSKVKKNAKDLSLRIKENFNFNKILSDYNILIDKID